MSFKTKPFNVFCHTTLRIFTESLTLMSRVHTKVAQIAFVVSLCTKITREDSKQARLTNKLEFLLVKCFYQKLRGIMSSLRRPPGKMPLESSM